MKSLLHHFTMGQGRIPSLTQISHSQKYGLTISKFTCGIVSESPKSYFHLCHDLRINLQIPNLLIILSHLQAIRTNWRHDSLHFGK
jgi:hypothetical protein